MAFVGLGKFDKTFDSQIFNNVWKASKALNTYGKYMKKHSGTIKKATETTSAFFSSVKGAVKGISSFAFDALGMMLQLAQKSGVLDPFVKMIDGIFAIIGGSAFETLGPVIEELAEFLFSGEMISFWKELGMVLGDFLKEMITGIMALLSNEKIKTMIISFVNVIGKILLHLGNIFGIFMGVLAGIDISLLGKVIWGIATTIAFFKGLALGGPLGALVGASFAGIVGTALAPLLAMQTGGYVPASSGGTIIQVAEGGEGEFIIPESKMDLGNQELLWATQDNGILLNRLASAMETQNKIMRLQNL